jgi:hypothetical protein
MLSSSVVSNPVALWISDGAWSDMVYGISYP